MRRARNLSQPGDTRVIDQPTDDVAHIFRLLARDDPDFEAAPLSAPIEY